METPRPYRHAVAKTLASAQVLVEEEDFFEVTWAYLQTVAAQNVVHTEMFFDPQVHTLRGVQFGTFMPGFLRAIRVGSNVI